MLDCQLFGLKPWGHHLTSVLLHAVNTVLVFLLLRSLTGALWRSVLVAALFGLHPLHVESVAWVAERKDVLSACFGLLALLFYARYAQTVDESQSGEREQEELSTVLQPSTLTLALWLRICLFPLGPDEQADAGDMAVRHVAAGLLAAASLRTFNSRLSTLNALAIGGGENPVLCPRGGRERRDLRGAEAGRRCDRRMKTCLWARAAGTP